MTVVAVVVTLVAVAAGLALWAGLLRVRLDDAESEARFLQAREAQRTEWLTRVVRERDQARDDCHNARKDTQSVRIQRDAARKERCEAQDQRDDMRKELAEMKRQVVVRSKELHGGAWRWMIERHGNQTCQEIVRDALVLRQFLEESREKGLAVWVGREDDMEEMTW